MDFIGGAGLRHQPDFVRRDVHGGDVFVDFGQVIGAVDDELPLAVVVRAELFDDGGSVSQLIVAQVPGGVFGGRVGEFRTQGNQVGCERAKQGSRGFDRQELAGLFELSGERDDGGLDQRFSAGDDDVFDLVIEHLGDDLFEGLRFSLGVPGGVRSIAEPATEIAAGGSDKDGGRSGELSFALFGDIDFRHAQGFGARCGK